MDTIRFVLRTPQELGEDDADELWREDYVVQIMINDIELVDILRPLEIPFCEQEGAPELAGDYAHCTPRDLYWELTNELFSDDPLEKNDAELLACAACGFSGCWSPTVQIHADAQNVYWDHFSHNHRDWDYGLSFVFDRAQYRQALKMLERMQVDCRRHHA